MTRAAIVATTALPRATWRESLFRALLAALLLWFIESLYLPFTYARPYLGSAWDWTQVYLQGLAVALLATLVLALAHRCLRWASVALVARVPAVLIPWVAAAQAALIAIVGVLLVNNGHGRRFWPAPWWQSLLALLPGVVLYLLLRKRARDNPTDYARAVLFWLILTAVHWAGYLTMYLAGRFGLEDAITRMRSVVLLGVPWLTAVVLAVFFTRARNPDKRAGWRPVVVLALVGVAYFANAHYYVDDSLDLHRTLHLLSILGAWYCAEFVGLPAWWGSRALLGGAACSAIALLGLTFSPPQSTARYFGGVHTTFQRLGFEVHTRFAAGPRVFFAPLGVVRARLGTWGILPAVPQRVEALPETFALNEKTQPPLSQPPQGAILLLLDMKRPRDLGIYGLSAPTLSPRIDECFRDAFIFDAAYSTSNSTRVAFPSLYTGTYPATRHQNHPMLVGPSFWTQTARKQNLGESFKAAGFKTTALLEFWYYQELFEPPANHAVYSGFSVIHVGAQGSSPDQMEKLYAAQRDVLLTPGRFLTIFHIIAHEIELLPAVDKLIGSICSDLKTFDMFERTALFLTADHGIQFREHGRTTYGHTVFDEEVRVPLLLRVPNMPGRRIADRVSGVDHLPTLLDIFSIPQTYPTEGVSYLPLLRGEPADPERVIFTETRKPIYSIAALQRQLKLIYWPGVNAFALFDLARDPGEVSNRAQDPAYADAFRFLSDRIVWFRKTHAEPYWSY